MKWICRVNATGEEFSARFDRTDFSGHIKGVAESFAANGEPTLDQARQQIDIWNRAQENYRNEFTYRIATQEPS